ncbi:MAG: hypothetical protein RL141_288 [Candidatus Parcubacteria bacterium]|jgi:type I restriction enzyme S subunit
MNLTPREQEVIRTILELHVPGRRVMLFGSRATGKNLKPFSDADIAIMGSDPIPLGIMGRLKEMFSASELPFRVDVVDWAQTSPEFREVIQRDGKEIVQA